MTLLSIIDVSANLQGMCGHLVTLDTRLYADRVAKATYLYQPDHDKATNVVAILQWRGLIDFLDTPEYWKYLRRVPGSTPYGLGPNLVSVTGVVSASSDPRCAFALRDPTELCVFGKPGQLYFRLTNGDLP